MFDNALAICTRTNQKIVKENGRVITKHQQFLQYKTFEENIQIAFTNAHVLKVVVAAWH